MTTDGTTAYSWRDEHVLEVDGVRFTSRVTERFASRRDDFCLVKRPDLTQAYLDLLTEERPKRIVEVGVFQGGSAALAALVADPDAMVAVELAPGRIDALDHLIESRGLGDRIHVAHGIDQADPFAVMGALAERGLHTGELDLVVDDASHLLGPSRRTFDTLFPLLRPGGTYVLEDWSWAHEGYGLHLPDEAPLTSLVFELTMAVPSRVGLIADLRITRDWAVVTRGDLPVNRGAFSISASYGSRGRDLLSIHRDD